ncbi:hypothetical protein BMS3Abin05_02476 [bacterium BMS3Abin05]|nr:hypothetical protein BMS3Abin05_02476 [bacterium BMS3Abin05]
MDIRKRHVIFRCRRNVLNIPDGIVADIAEQPPVEKGNIFRFFVNKCAQNRFQDVKGIFPVCGGFSCTGIPDRRDPVFAPENQKGRVADNRIAAPPRAAFHAFQQKSVGLLSGFEKCGNGRIHIAHDLRIDRDKWKIFVLAFKVLK